MGRRLVLMVSAIMVTAVSIGCRSASFSYYEERPRHHRHRPVRVYEVPHGHVCSRDCHDHYWDGTRVVVIQSGHRHHPGCGHEWDGRRWVVVGKAPTVSKAPAERVHEGPRRKTFKPDHIHSATCGCVWNRREQEWMPVEPGHVHGRNCGHVFVDGRWTLPR